MWLGPVFQAELLTLSRRPRFFVGRGLYGSLVLVVVTLAYRSYANHYDAENEIPIDRLAEIGQAIFTSFAWLQGLVVLVMTPALVAGTIADEKQRKTLHYLMASQLSAFEIVLGKTAARLLRIAVLGAIGLPVLALVGLFGGVDYEEAALVYLATATTTFFLAGVAIFCSVHASKPRDAIIQTYIVEALWLTVAPLCLATMPSWSARWKAVGEWFRPVLAYMAISSPSDLFRNPLLSGPPGSRWVVLGWMMAMHVIGGAGLIVIAALRLRPVYRGLDGPGWRARFFRRGGGRRLKIWNRPPIGADAMLWKELHLQRISDTWRLVLLLTGAVGLGLLMTATIESAEAAIREAWNYGYWTYGTMRQEVNGVLRVVTAVAMVLLIMGLGTVAASTISSEREGDTWINLAASPIEGPEFIRAKILGTFRLFQPIGYLLLACWGFGLAVGAIHPVGFVVSVVDLGVFAWFISSLGVWVSLGSKNSIQALGITVGTLLVCNVGFLFLCLLLRIFDEMILIGCMPYLAFNGLLGGDEIPFHAGSRATDTLPVGLGGVVLYGIAAALLTARAIAGYDRAVGRPSRARAATNPERRDQRRVSSSAPSGR